MHFIETHVDFGPVFTNQQGLSDFSGPNVGVTIQNFERIEDVLRFALMIDTEMFIDLATFIPMLFSSRDETVTSIAYIRSITAFMITLEFVY